MQVVLAALQAAGLRAGAVCIRFPAHEMRLGAFTHPSEGVRRRAVALAAEGCKWAQALGASELVVWSAFDGYDYNFQVRLQLPGGGGGREDGFPVQ